MPSKHFTRPTPAVDQLTLLAHECSVLYEVLLAEVNHLRRDVGLPERTLDDVSQARQQVLGRLQAARDRQGAP